jgi:hypothetical protein
MTVVPLPVPLPPAKPSGFKGIVKRAWAGFLTAVTSSSAVKAEKNLAVTVVTGVLLAVGASTGLVELVQALISNA